MKSVTLALHPGYETETAAEKRQENKEIEEMAEAAGVDKKEMN